MPAEHPQPAHSPAVVLTEGPIARTWRRRYLRRRVAEDCAGGNLAAHTQRRSRWTRISVGFVRWLTSAVRGSRRRRHGVRVAFCAAAHRSGARVVHRSKPHLPGPKRTDLPRRPVLRRPLQLPMLRTHHDDVVARFRVLVHRAVEASLPPCNRRAVCGGCRLLAAAVASVVDLHAWRRWS